MTPIEFLKHEFGKRDGFISITAISIKDKISTRAAACNDIDSLAPFIDKHIATDNLYWSVNPLKTKMNKKASKDDVASLAYLHNDIDPDPKLPFEDERKRILSRIREFNPLPNIVIDSGGGYQAFWRLAVPIPVDNNIDELETYSKRFGGDHCWNIDRIMRLPETTNFPTTKKIQKGRSPEQKPTKLIYCNESSYTLSDFDSSLPNRFTAMLGTDAKLAARWNGDMDGLNDSSRSGMDMSMVSMLVRRKFIKDDIRQILLEYQHGKFATEKDKERSLDRMIALAGESHYEDSMSHAVVEFIKPEPITLDEWQVAKLTPTCLVEDYLFFDVAQLIGPGGVSKTTLMLFEAIHIILGRPLYGLSIEHPGQVVYVTAEDERERLVARTRMIAQDLLLTDDEIAKVRAGFHISDTSGTGFRLTAIINDLVKPSPELEQLIEECERIRPVLVLFDPAVSFGVGESRVNDAEQGLIEAARRIIRRVPCCVRYAHHTGKGNARDGAVDQYGGRGGSTFPDGSRMVCILQPLDAESWASKTGTKLADDERGLILARPKNNYIMGRGDILLIRHRYHFQHIPQLMDANNGKSIADSILQFLIEELERGNKHSTNSLSTAPQLGIPRQKVRNAVALLIGQGSLEERDIENPGKGGMRKYLHPIIASPLF